MPLPTQRQRRRALTAAVVVGIALSPLTAPATIEEQRARLPAPAHCADPIEGTWVSLRFVPHAHTWNFVTATLRRSAPGAEALVGELLVESWTGDAAQTTPPACGPRVRHQVFEQTVVGRWDDLTRRVSIDATAWWSRAVHCRGWGNYALDHYTGAVDRERDELQAVNNDNSSAVNEPAVFRRVSCATRRMESPPTPAPPPRERRSCLPW